MTIPQHILDTAYSKEGMEREEYLIEVLETIFCTTSDIMEKLPPEVHGMQKQRIDVLRMLLLNAGKAVYKRDIVAHTAAILGKEYIASRKHVAVQISHIRKVLPESFGTIETVHGVGYRLNLAEAAQ